MEDRASPVTAPAPTPPAASFDLHARKRDWWLQAMERQRQLSPAASVIERRTGVGRQEFLDRYYAPGRPVLMCGELDTWPALTRWTPDYLAKAIGPALIEYQGERSRSPTFEMHKDAHTRTEPFDAFLARIGRPDAANDAYLTAYNAARNAEALAPLWQDIRPLESFLHYAPAAREGMMWIGPAGAFTPLHHDLTNNLFVQVVGRKRMKLLPPTQVGRLYNQTHVFSEISDLDGEAVRQGLFPHLEGASIYEIDVLPGEVLFIPLGWWHQVRALDFSISMTFTNFHWPNDAAASYPVA